MASKEGVDYRVVSALLAAALVLVSGYHLYVVGGLGPAGSSGVASNDSGVHVFYLYPARCVNCDLNQAGQCDYCTSYYGEDVLGLLGDEIGVPASWYVSDAVERPNVLVASGRRVSLGDARSKYNIAHTVCELTGVNRACELYGSEVRRVRWCAGKYGLANSTLVYHYAGSGCNACAKTTPIVGELEGLSYNDTVNYSVKYVDHNSREDLKLLNDCFASFSSIDYVPQVLCPANGKDLTGVFTLSKLRDFADDCIKVG